MRFVTISLEGGGQHADLSEAEGCPREVLRWGHLEEEEVAPEAGQREKANEGHWQGERAAGSFHGGLKHQSRGKLARLDAG